jgi:hypothetical protein
LQTFPQFSRGSNRAIHLTRPEISDGYRERASIEVELF